MALLTAMTLEEHGDDWDADPAYGSIRRQFEALLGELVPPPPAEQSPAEAKVVAESLEADARHDRYVGGIDRVLDGVALLDPAHAAEYGRLRARLFPNGPRTQGSYAEEAATPRQVGAALDDADRALMRAIPLPGGRTLEHAFDDWMQACRDLESLERRRLDLRLTVAPKGTRLVEARNRWIRLVHALDELVAINGGSHRLLGAVRTYEEKADRRASAATDRQADAPPPAPPIPA
jgi:hypothetical protein